MQTLLQTHLPYMFTCILAYEYINPPFWCIGNSDDVGAIIGGVVGGVTLLVIVVVVVVLVCRIYIKKLCKGDSRQCKYCCLWSCMICYACSYVCTYEHKYLHLYDIRTYMWPDLQNPVIAYLIFQEISLLNIQTTVATWCLAAWTPDSHNK